jgi:hypothetical protein
MIRVILPAHLRTLARVNGEVKVEVAGKATQRAVLDALELAILRCAARSAIRSRSSAARS